MSRMGQNTKMWRQRLKVSGHIVRLEAEVLLLGRSVKLIKQEKELMRFTPTPRPSKSLLNAGVVLVRSTIIHCPPFSGRWSRINRSCTWKMAPNKRDHPENLSPHVVEWTVQTLLHGEGVVLKSFCQIYPHMLGAACANVRLPYQSELPRPVNTPLQSRTPVTLICAATTARNLRAGKTLEISHFGTWTLWDKVQKK